MTPPLVPNPAPTGSTTTALASTTAFAISSVVGVPKFNSVTSTLDAHSRASSAVVHPMTGAPPAASATSAHLDATAAFTMSCTRGGRPISPIARVVVAERAIEWREGTLSGAREH